jgi:hypothetical protein
MQFPKVKSVAVVDDHTLLIEFDNQQKKHYDVEPLFSKKMFEPLKNPQLFRSVRVDQGGYAVVWNSEIDISEHELWRHGQTVVR